MEISEQDVSGVTEVVWSSMLQLDVSPCPVWAAGIEDAPLVATVGISGAWCGAVQLSCPTALLREAAAAVFGVSPDEANRLQVREALAELANMTAGNLKALLPEPCELGLPAVAEDSAEPPYADGAVVAEAGFSCHGHPFVVRIVGAAAA